MDNSYKPKNKQEREARRNIWDRYTTMKDDSIRKEEEDQWDLADKAYMQWMPDREEGDWRSHLVLPDAFSAIQSSAQETIERRSRPALESVEDSDISVEQFCNDILKHSMDRTQYDFENYQAKTCASIRGTAFVMERYRFEKREVQDPDSIDKEGNIVYKKREIIDYDDTVTEFCENNTIYIDPSQRDQNRLRDMIEREILDLKEYQRVYKNKPGFINVDKVKAAGQLDNKAQFFQQPNDVTDDQVEILHYYNRSTDSYDVLANNVLIRLGPIPFKHKELPLAIYRHYIIPGRIYGMGIPRVIYSLSEERASIRRLNLDRQNLNGNKVFLSNDLVDMDEEDVRSRPNGIIQVNTNGMPLSQVIQPLEFGDTPPSSYKSEEMLLEDIRRAHGIYDNNQNVPTGSTATEAAIMKEVAQKRINLISIQSEMSTIIRIGRLKWSNIQFFYPAPKVERLTANNQERQKKLYRKIRVQGKAYALKEENGGISLDSSEIEGTSGFILDPTMAKFMEGDFDVTMGANPAPVLSKPLQQAKITEMIGTLMLNPLLASTIDPIKAAQRYIKIHDEDPKTWMTGKGLTEDQWKRLAIQENNVMAVGIPLVATEGANEAHTMEHLHFTETQPFSILPPPVQANIGAHIMGEDAARGGSAAQMGGTPGPQGGLGSNTPPEGTVGDMEANTPAGGDQQDAALDQQRA
jgi:hypothetical protein